MTESKPVFLMGRTPPLNLKPSPETVKQCIDNLKAAREAILQVQRAHEYATRFFINACLPSISRRTNNEST